MGYTIRIFDGGLLVDQVYADSKRAARAIAKAQSRRFGTVGTAIVTGLDTDDKFTDGQLIDKD
jgi:hypothetical protein